MNTQRLIGLAAYVGLWFAGSVVAATISGTATYRERIALPPAAVFEATVEDVSRADAPASVIGRIVLTPVEQVPIRFALSVDDSLVEPGHRYSLRASIRQDGKLLFTTTRIYPVLGEGAGNPVQMLLQRVPASSPITPDRTLTNTYWKLTELKGAQVEVAPQQREPHLILQLDPPRLTGSGGCNRLLGSYTLERGSLTFGKVASTMMACADGMAQETAFFRTLETVRAWKIQGDQLDLLDQRGQVVARLVAVDLR